MDTRHRTGLPCPQGFAQLRVTRRHVDLLRVSSALCPGTPAES